MRTRYAAVAALALFAPVVWAVGGPTAATGGAALVQVGTLTAGVHRGSCADLDPVPVAALGEIGAWATPSPPAIPVRYVETRLDQPLTDLVTGPHAVAISLGNDVDALLACGNLGSTAEGDQVALGLPEQNGSGISGIAWFTAGEAGTLASVMVLEGLDDPTALPAPPPPDAPLGVGLFAGTCDALAPEPSLVLAAAAPWAVPRVEPPAEPALLSFTDLPRPLSDLVATPHALVVGLGGAAGPPVACGDLGGEVQGGTLGVGLREQNGSAITGFAWLNGEGPTTPISVVVAQGLDDEPVVAVATPVAASPAATPLGPDRGTPVPAAATPVAGDATPVASSVGSPAAIGSPAPAETPSLVAPTPAAATATPPPTTPTGESAYVSEQFGYAVDWEPPWQLVAPPSVNEGNDYLALTNGPSYLDFFGAATDWTAPECIDALYEEWLLQRPGLRLVTPHTGVDADLYLRTDERAIEVWDVSLTDDAGRTQQLTTYAQCLVLDPGRSVLLTTHEAPRDAYPTEAARREEVYGNVRLP